MASSDMPRVRSEVLETVSDQLTDRAREWVNENHPDLTGEELHWKLIAVELELMAIDYANDTREEIERLPA